MSVPHDSFVANVLLKNSQWTDADTKALKQYALQLGRQYRARATSKEANERYWRKELRKAEDLLSWETEQDNCEGNLYW